MTRDPRFPDDRPVAGTTVPGSSLPSPASYTSATQRPPSVTQPGTEISPLEPDDLLNDRPELVTVPPPAAPPRRRRSWKMPTSWRFWALAAGGVTVGIGVFSIAALLRLPALPNCPSIFWPMASASLRLYCAEVAANKQTLKDLLEAIALVDSLPADHPLRPEINRMVESWAMDILRIGDETFNAGELKDAIATAEKIPQNTSAYDLVNERIQQWQRIWSNAETIYRQAETELNQQDWPTAFRQAVRLLDVGNTYWETVKYQELVDKIRVARETNQKLGRARVLARRGGMDNLLEAIKLAESIEPDSYVYPAAQEAIAEFGQQMLDLAEEALDGKDRAGAIAIAFNIPASAKLQKEVEDFTLIAQAAAHAWGGTIPSLEDAIAQAQQVKRDRPLYRKAQDLVSRWQQEISDVSHLNRARQLAQGGTVKDLTAAIDAVSLVPQDNPRWSEAKQLIKEWTATIQTIEDRPILDRADFLAEPGDVASLSAAVQEAKQITSDRALYSEARSRIRDWSERIQRTQDQPVLDEAIALADAGNLPQAIDAAERIQPGRVLYDDAQGKLKSWRDQVQAQQNLTEAYRLAESRTPDGLLSAIQRANRIPASSPLSSEANRVITQWSQEVLAIAAAQADYDVPGAIALAQKIPARTSLYAEAQLRIADWKKLLNPPTAPSSLSPVEAPPATSSNPN